MSKGSKGSQAAKVSHMGVDCHRNFSKVTARDEQGRVVFRQRLEHADRSALREELRRWPAGTPVVLDRPPQRPGAAAGQTGDGGPKQLEQRRASRPEAGGPDRPMAAAAP